MKNKKMILIIACAFVILTSSVVGFVVYNNKKSGIEIEEPEIILDKRSYQLKNGETVRLTATITPDEYSDIDVFWESTDENVATVSKDGLVKAIDIGSTYIIAQAKDVGSARCEIIVSEDDEIVIKEIELSKTSLSLEVGDEEILEAYITPENAKDKTLKWDSNPEIVEVDQNGKVKAINVGKTTITVLASNGVYAKCEVEVKEKKKEEKQEEKKEEQPKEVEPIPEPEPEPVKVDVTGLDISNNDIEMLSTDSEKMNVVITPSNATETNLTWTSSNPSVATVDSNGNVKAVAKGETTITVTSTSGVSTTSHVKVKHNILLLGNSVMYRPESDFTKHRIASQFLRMAYDGGYIDELFSTTNNKVYVVDKYIEGLNATKKVSLLKSSEATIAAINGSSTIHKKGFFDDIISNERYDIVVTVENKTDMINYSVNSENHQNIINGMTWLKSSLKNKNARLFFRSNWVNKNDLDFNAHSLVVSNNSKEIANMFGMTQIEDALIIAKAKEEGIDIFYHKDSHQNENGAYLIALCMYAKIFHENPKNVTWHDFIEDEAIVNRLKDIAYTYCY